MSERLDGSRRFGADVVINDRDQDPVAARAMVAQQRVDLSPLVTHQFSLDSIDEAFDLFSHQRDGVMKVALHPVVPPARQLTAGSRDVALGSLA